MAKSWNIPRDRGIQFVCVTEALCDRFPWRIRRLPRVGGSNVARCPHCSKRRPLGSIGHTGTAEPRYLWSKTSLDWMLRRWIIEERAPRNFVVSALFHQDREAVLSVKFLSISMSRTRYGTILAKSYGALSASIISFENIFSWKRLEDNRRLRNSIASSFHVNLKIILLSLLPSTAGLEIEWQKRAGIKIVSWPLTNSPFAVLPSARNVNQPRLKRVRDER